MNHSDQGGNSSLIYRAGGCRISDQCHIGMAPYDLFWFLFAIFGSLGNMAVVIIVAAYKKLHTKTFFLIGSIAFADSIYTIVNSLISVQSIMKPPHGCRWCSFSFNWKRSVSYHLVPVRDSFYTTSCLLLSLLAVCRFIILLYPFQQERILKKWTMVFLVVLMYIIPIPTQFITPPQTKNIVHLIIQYPMNALIIIIFHTLKLIKLRRMPFAQKNMYLKKMSVTCAIVIGSFVLISLPWQIMHLIGTFIGFRAIPVVLLHSGRILKMLNSCINPYLYVLFSPDVKRKIMNLRRIFPCGRHHGEVVTRNKYERKNNDTERGNKISREKLDKYTKEDAEQDHSEKNTDKSTLDENELRSLDIKDKDSHRTNFTDVADPDVKDTECHEKIKE